MSNRLHEVCRQSKLKQFAEALRNACESMPAGYQGAGQDRERFLSPIETVLLELEQQVSKL